MGFASSLLGWRGPASPRRGDSTRRSPPKRPPPHRGCRRVRGAANTPRCCIIYKPEEQRAQQQLQSPPGPPCPASRSHRARWHSGTAAPAARRDNGDEAARGAGRATGRPDATLASPRTGRAAGAARGDVRRVPVSPAPARHPQAASRHRVNPLQMGLGDGSKGVSPPKTQPAPAPGGIGQSPGCTTAPFTKSRMWPRRFLTPLGSVCYGKQVFLKLCRILPPPPPATSPTSGLGGARGGWERRLSWGF